MSTWHHADRVTFFTYMYERDCYDAGATLFMILTSICMAMAGEGEERLVAPALPLARGSEEL